MDLLRKLLEPLIGRLRWTPPAWPAGLRQSWSKTDPADLRRALKGLGAILALALLTNQWSRQLPEKEALEFQLLTPGPTKLEKDAKPDPLIVRFSGSAAKLAQIGKAPASRTPFRRLRLRRSVRRLLNLAQRRSAWPEMDIIEGGFISDAITVHAKDPPSKPIYYDASGIYRVDLIRQGTLSRAIFMASRFEDFALRPSRFTIVPHLLTMIGGRRTRDCQATTLCQERGLST